jgi:hypothetical protein
MSFSYGMLDRDLTKAARNVNEMVQEFPTIKLTRCLKINRAPVDAGAPFFQPCGGELFS